MLWVALNLRTGADNKQGVGIDVCLFHRITGLPCPSCGSTHAILYIARFKFADALYTNPIGFLLAAAMIIFPFWIFYDLLSRKNSFYDFYHTLEAVIRNRWVTIMLIFLFSANWLWNIHKFA